MTDYLERVEMGTTDALLEQTRRLEQALSGLGTWGEKEEEKRSFEASLLEHKKPSAEFSTFPVKTVEKKTDGRAESEENTPETGEVKGKTPQKNLPLMEELIRLDRAAARAGGAIGTENRTLTSQGAGEPGRRRPRSPGGSPGFRGRGNSALPEPGETGANFTAGFGSLQAGGELSLAEQADRAFRRDSRRYDGGFYLY